MPNTDSWYQLPVQMEQWQQVIIENLARKVPESPAYISGLEFNRLEPILGEADGMLYLLNGLAAIPITIRNNRLAPLDLMVTKKEEFYPVTETFLQKVYADNVIGEPSDVPGRQDDLQEDGPARKVRYYNTVDRVKQASYQTKVALQREVSSNETTLNMLNETNQGLLAEILSPVEAAQEGPAQKLASLANNPMPETPAPEIHFLAKVNDDYFFNGESVTVKEAAEFMNAAHFSDEEKTTLMNGGFACLDYREKHAGVVIEVKDETEEALPVAASPASTNLQIATTIGVDGVPLRGLLYRKTMYGWDRPNRRKDEFDTEYQHLFISDHCYALQDDVKILDATDITLKHLKEISVPSEPKVGMFGVVIDGYRINGPLNVGACQQYGKLFIIRTLSNNLEPQEYTIGDEALFYEVPEERVTLVRNADDQMMVTPGKNCIVYRTPEGKMIVDGVEDSYTNTVFNLMSKYAMAYEDAMTVADTALNRGKAIVKVAMPEVEQAAMSPEFYSATVAQQQAAAANQAANNQLYQGPVKFDDIHDIAKINDPSLMDAYLTGKLTDVNTAGREQIMQAGDDILEAIKSLGKVLFLVRLGKIDYVKEEDAQTALSKLSDVARGLGISSSQLL